MENPVHHAQQYAEISAARSNPEIAERVEEVLASAAERWEESLMRGVAGPSLVATQHAALVAAGLIKDPA